MMTEYTGKILRVDMSKGELERVTIDDKTMRKLIGGTSLGAKFLYDEVLPGTDWSDPENRFILAAGPLNGTPMGGSGSISIVTKGALTNGAGCCQTNGYFGAYLRLCGLHGIIVKGRAQNLKYLYIDSESDELKDADWLAGTDTYKTADLVKHEHDCKERDMAVASIGPAGENLVKFAGVFVDWGHSASHNGLGAVMG
jgi:aldehyde:ferredoxin oxidoreductase